MHRFDNLLVLLAMASTAVNLCAAEQRVSSPAELDRAMSQVQPGDTILLADGTWTDQEIILRGRGLESQPITIRAETPGNLVLTGKSSLTIDGEYLVVNGIWMKKCGETKDTIALKGNHCRLTECSITDGTSKFFVHLFGSESRVDHCYLAGKTSDSPTLQVEAEGTANHHRIDHNDFGPRAPLGRNGGETIRVGYSHQSMHESGTVVESNLFDRCDGELEIISNKSCGNTYRGNTFLNSGGTLTLRHGNRCVVEANYFFGKHKRGSGGIRVIGEDHTITNNYIDGVELGAFWITSGIVDSPLDGYFQARRCLIAFNTVVDTKGPGLLLDAGIGTSRRTLRPEHITIANNLFSMPAGEALLRGAEGESFAWIGNMAAPSQSDLSHTGWRMIDPMLERAQDAVWRPAQNSPARGAAQGDFPSVKSDIDGQMRNSPFDVGCDQVSAEAASNRPLSAGDVGPSWMKRGETR